MTNVSSPGSDVKSPGYEVFIAALSTLSIINLALRWVIDDRSVEFVVIAMNMLLSLILLIDFLYRFATSPDRRRYFFRGFGWADLLSSLPLMPVKLLRGFRLVRVFRALRALGYRSIVGVLLRRRAGSALLSLLFVAILVLEFGSLAMLLIEQNAPDANITTASDALWYVIVTMATVGYGDAFPVTNAGRLLGTLIIILGVGVFGTLTGFLATAFMQPPQMEPAEPGPGEPGPGGTRATDPAPTG